MIYVDFTEFTQIKYFAGQSTNYKASEMSNVSFLTDTLQNQY